jgi:hypothetical protein
VQLLFLALEAALYPTLLAAVVILLAQPRRLRLLSAYLAGGLVVSIGAGLLIVHYLQDSGELSDSSSTLSWTADLAVGGLALLAAVALATRADERYRARRAARKAAPAPSPDDDEREPWSTRLLAGGSTPIVFAAGLVINVPGAAYLVGLKDIAAAHHPTGTTVALVVGFNLIMFMLAEIPWLGLLLRPDAVQRGVDATNAWLGRNGRTLAIGLCAVLGLFLVVRGIVQS